MELTAQRRIVLGMQHALAMFGATVLVPILTGLSPSVALVAAGVGTLLFHLVTKRIVPVFLGSSFAFIAAIVAARQEGYDLGQVGGGIMVAGLVYVAVSFLVRAVGSGRIRRLLPPIVAGPVIAIIGITLAPVAIDQAQGNWWVAIVTLLAAVITAIWARGLFKMLPILMAAVIGYAAAAIAGLVDFEAVSAADWIGLPDFVAPTFSGGAIALIAPVALVTMVEHVGDILTNGRVVGKDFFAEPGLDRTLLGDGLATTLAGLIGGPANTTYSENTGVLAVTRVYDPGVLRIGAAFAIVLGLIPKVGALLLTIPVPVLGGLSIILFGMIAAIGLRTLAESGADFTKSRNLIVVALILVFGLGISNVGGIVVGNVTISGLALAAVIGVVANLVLPEAMEEPVLTD